MHKLTASFVAVVAALAFVLGGSACDLIGNTAACNTGNDCPSSLPACSAHQCQATCATDDECASGFACGGGACVKRAGEGEGEGALGEGEGEGVAGEGEGEGVAGEGEGEGEGEGQVRGLLAGEIQIDDSSASGSHTGDNSEARVACNADGSQCLIVWRDDRSEGFEVGDIFGALVDIAASSAPVVFPITLDDGEQNEPDVCFTGGVFVVVWEDDAGAQPAVVATTVDGAGNVAPELVLASGARTPSINAVVDVTTGFEARVVFQQTANGNLRVVRLTSLAVPSGADVADIGVSSSIRAAVAATTAETGVLWVDPSSTVIVSRAFVQTAAADVSVEHASDVERLALAAVSGGYDVAVSHSSTNTIDLATVAGSVSTPTPGPATTGNDGALALDGTLALRNGGSLELAAFGASPQPATASATRDVGVACNGAATDACLLVGDNDGDGVVVGATIGSTSVTQRNFGRGAQRQDNVAAAETGDGHVVVVWSERTNDTSAELKARVFPADLSTTTASAVSDLGAIDIDVPTSIGTDGTRVVAGAKQNGGLHLFEVSVVDASALQETTFNTSVSSTEPIALVPTGTNGVVVAFTDGAHVHALPASDFASIGSVAASFNNDDSSPNAPALIAASDHDDLVWAHPDGSLAAATISTSTANAAPLSVDATCTGTNPVASGVALQTGVVAVRTLADASIVAVCPFTDGGVGAPLASTALDVGARFTIARVNAADVVVAATSVADPAHVGFTTIATADGNVTGTTTLFLRTPVRSLAVVPGFAIYHRFDDDPAVVANRALAIPLP